MNVRTLRGDLAGGLTAAVQAIPVELVYGLLAVAPLGAAFADHGLRAALWGCALGGVLGFLFRTHGGMITGTRPATGLVLGTLAYELLQHPDVSAAPDPAATAFVLLLLCTALAGLCKAMFGLARGGRALKYVPYPVISGLMCGVGLLMLLSAIKPMLGLPRSTAWSEIGANWHVLSLLIGGLALLICFHAPRWTKRVPATVLALIAGTLAHIALVSAVGHASLGPTSAAAAGLLPDYSVWRSLIDGGGAELATWLRFLLPYSLAIAAFASLEHMLCVATIESHFHERLDGDRELSRVGAANIVGGLLGATTVVGNLSRIKANLGAGASSPLSALFYAIFIALFVVAGGSWIAFVPHAATSGILIFYAWGMVDDGTRRMARQVLLERQSMSPEHYRVLLANFTVIVAVALVAAVSDMMEALAVGMAAAIILFVRSNMKPVIRRIYDGRLHRSLKVRTPEHEELLQREGHRTVVIEIDGTLFFGTADRAARAIEKRARQASSIILDLSRVVDVDPTGARTLLQVARQLRGKQCELVISGADDHVEQFLRAMGLTSVMNAANWCHDIDTALERAEDRLLNTTHTLFHAEEGLQQTTLAQGLDDAQVRVLEGYLEKKVFDSTGHVFEIGAEGDSLYVACGGVVDIFVPLNNGRRKRIASFAPGTIFGEMALLEGKPRSADAVVQGTSTVWELKRHRLADLELEHPALASRILVNLGRSLAHRVRATTEQLRQVVEAR